MSITIETAKIIKNFESDKTIQNTQAAQLLDRISKCCRQFVPSDLKDFPKRKKYTFLLKLFVDLWIFE